MNLKWRDKLISLLQIDFFNPVVDDWNEEAQENERRERQECDFVLYVITPKMTGVYSIAEVVDDSNKRPEKTIFCVAKSDGDKHFTNGELKSLAQVKRMVDENGAKVFNTFQEIADYLNEA